MVDDVFKLAGRSVTAPGNADGTEGNQGKVGDDPGVAVVGQEKNLGPPADFFLGKGAGEEQDIFVELAVSDNMLLAGGTIDERLALRVQAVGA